MTTTRFTDIIHSQRPRGVAGATGFVGLRSPRRCRRFELVGLTIRLRPRFKTTPRFAAWIYSQWTPSPVSTSDFAIYLVHGMVPRPAWFKQICRPGPALRDNFARVLHQGVAHIVFSSAGCSHRSHHLRTPQESPGS